MSQSVTIKTQTDHMLGKKEGKTTQVIPESTQAKDQIPNQDGDSVWREICHWLAY